MKKKVSVLQCTLTVIAVVCLLLSNIIVIKQVQLPFGIEVTGGFFIFPITYILSDVFSEVYGYKWSRFTCYLSFALAVFMSIIFAAVVASPSTSYFALQPQLEAVLGNTPRMVFASLTAFAVGDFFNDKVFHIMKKSRQSHQGFALRAIMSSIAGGLGDTFIFYIIAFIGTPNFIPLFFVTLFELVLKIVYEIIVLPVTKVVMHKVSEYESNLKDS